ncbi:MAG: sugar phosphate isomerase/epimerase [Vallitaleaceae bacterium]|nr:sugar phosphate isomerase/epimerase [Vallitaleaceae bacterium]
MKLSVSNIAWDSDQDKKVYSFLFSNSIKGIEVAPTRLFPNNPYSHNHEAYDFAKKIKELYDLSICSLQSIWFGKNESMFVSEKSLNEYIDYTIRAIDFAHSCNCKNIVFGNPKQRSLLEPEDYNRAIRFFSIVGERAVADDVIIAIEPNPIIYGTNLLNRTDQVLEFVTSMNMQSIRINFDIGTFIQNEEDNILIEKSLPWINHIHLSEPNLCNIQIRPTHKMIHKILKNSCYNRWVSLEMKKTSSLNDLFRSIKYMKGVFNDNQY